MRNDTIYLSGKRVKVTAYLHEPLPGNQQHAGAEGFPAILILPGGAYLFTAPSEGKPVAKRFYREGYQTFVLDYSTHASNRALRDNQEVMPQLREIDQALRMIRERDAEYGIDPDRICLMGFSAGANLASCYAALFAERGYEPVQAVVLGYPVLDHPDNNRWAEEEAEKQAPLLPEEAAAKEKMIRISNRCVFGTVQPDEAVLKAGSAMYLVNGNNPPTFMWHTFGDEMVHPMQTLRYAEALHLAGVPCEVHVFRGGRHAMSLADESIGEPDKADPAIAMWVPLSLNWLETYL